MGETIINPDIKKTFPWKLAVIFLLFSAAIILIGSYFSNSQRNRIFKEQENNLSAIASLKISQIASWHKERLGDAKVISLDKPLIISIEYFFSGKNKEIKTQLYYWMKSVRNEYDYSNVLIADTSLKVRLSVTPSDSVLGDSIKMEMKASFKSRNIFMTDLHRSKETPYIHIDILIPLFDSVKNKTLPVGIALLRIDPGKVLFPLIQSWPTPSKSSETLILRREGDSVLYLNELRHRKNTALNLKFPLSNANLLATKAVNGFEGVTEGIDYRKIPVVGALSKIPGLPWYMVAKTDKEEILAPFKRYSIITVVVIILLIILNALVSGYWIWAQRAKIYRRQLKDEIALRESNEKLIASEERFRSLYENATIGIYRTTPDGKILLANPALVRMLGFSSFEDLAHRNLEVEGYEPDYPRAKFLEILEKEDKIIGLESAWHQRNGNNLYVRESASVIRDEEGKILYYDGNVEDITYRKQAEEALRESEERFSKSFRTSPISFMIANIEDGRIIEINDAFSSISGFTREEAIGNTTLNMKIWIHEEDRKQMIDSLRKGKPILHMETMLRAKEGNVAIVLLSAQVIKLANRNCIISSIEDITERKNAESQIKKLNEELEDRVIQRTELLEAANKELEAFSYSVSHDLRAPLRSVHGFTKILLEDYEANLDEEGKRICGIISSSATQMGELIDDLLSFSRIGRSSMNPSAIDMKKMARVVFEGMTSPAERKRIKLNIGKLQKAYGDFTLFGQVWTNLISNAIKYSSKNDVSEISIGSKIAGDMIIYFIKDNGVGFDMQYAHKLFGVFQRLHSEVEFEGNGVGLAIIQRIILKHGGKVWAEGEVGKGATFYFSLPVQDINKKTHDTRLTTYG
jgi:PAS domain S-box-containing protein